ncbi:MAG: DUF4276 family protein [Saprospiraceae bacterium]
MKRIGIVGENFDNDSKPIRNLLNIVFEGKGIFIPLLKTYEGNQLERVRKVTDSLNSEIENKNIDLIILVRDLDGLSSETEKIRRRNQWFSKIEKGAKKKCIRFLIIYELEALILADITTFNKIYKTKYQPKGKPKFQKDPKGLLKKLTARPKKTYHESHAADIFQKISHQELLKNHSGKAYSYESFIKELENTLN